MTPNAPVWDAVQLRDWRQRMGWTSGEAARQLGIGAAAYSGAETNARVPRPYTTLACMALEAGLDEWAPPGESGPITHLRLRQWREILKWRQADAGIALSMTQQKYCDMENGQRAKIGRRIGLACAALAAGLHLTESDFDSGSDGGVI